MHHFLQMLDTQFSVCSFFSESTLVFTYLSKPSSTLTVEILESRRVIFRTFSSIYDVALLRKQLQLTTKKRPGHLLDVFKPFKHEPHKMVKHPQTIRWLLPTNCLGVFNHFGGLALKGLKWAHLEKYMSFDKKESCCLGQIQALDLY